MISLDDTAIREIDGAFIVTTTLTVETPTPGTHAVRVEGKTLEDGLDNLVDYIRGCSDEDEETLQLVKSTQLDLIHGFDLIQERVRK